VYVPGPNEAWNCGSGCDIDSELVSRTNRCFSTSRCNLVKQSHKNKKTANFKSWFKLVDGAVEGCRVGGRGRVGVETQQPPQRPANICVLVSSFNFSLRCLPPSEKEKKTQVLTEGFVVCSVLLFFCVG
jgi:hypothetical protein